MTEELRNSMKNNDIDWFVVFSSDEHLSEYTGECDRFIRRLTGFTGSAGTLVVSESEAYFFTDSRYHIQAEKQLAGKDITVMKCGLPNVPDPIGFLSEHVWEGQIISYDQKTISYEKHTQLVKILPESVTVTDGSKILRDLCDDMPPKRFETITAVPEKKSGRLAVSKLKSVREKIEKETAGKSYTYIVSDPTSIMWLFNLRGKDISHVPVAYSYAMITAYQAAVYLNKRSLDSEASEALKDAGVTVKEYSAFYKDLESVGSDIVLGDLKKNNCRILRRFDEEGMFSECADSKFLSKAVKNSAETEGMKEAHIKDAAVMIRFIKKIKEDAAKEAAGDEYTTGKMLDEMRLSAGCSDLSFSTICAYAENAAIVHYTADETGSKKLDKKGFLLVDSGGQYEYTGTTDITRTISLGELTDEEKKAYTVVLKGHLRLMGSVFPSGYCGTFLDGIAEQPLWDEGYFCGHGIGHGVGCYLSVHESEASITRSTSKNETAITPGVIVSDEPGVYIEGKFGIRTENLLLAKRDKEIDGHVMCSFYPLTLVPYDKEALIYEMLNEREREILHDYYRLIEEKIMPLLDENEQKWLRNYMNLE